jgi:hypothetical protein
MMRLSHLLTAALLCPLAALAEPSPEPPVEPSPEVSSAPGTVRLHLRGGLMFFEDASFDAVDEQPQRGDSRIGAAYRFTDHVWAGVSIGGGGHTGSLYKALDSQFSVFGFRGYGEYRQPIAPWLAWNARAGLGYHRLELSFSEPGRSDLEDSHWVPALHGAVGVELLPIQSTFFPDLSSSFAFGVSLELTYDRYLPADFSAGGVDLGDVDPSGPGFLVGLVLQF